MALPSERGLAERPTPVLGGAAILIAVLVAAALWMPDVIHLPRTAHARPGPGPIVHIWLVLAGAAVIAIVGLIDDAVELRPQWKLLGEIIAALVAVTGGVAVTDVTLPFIPAGRA